MRHRKRGRKLGRNASHRKAMFRNMANSLFEHEQIITTVAKAKELRPFAEKMITIARRAVSADREAQKIRERADKLDKQSTERAEVLAEWRKAVAPVLHATRLLTARLGKRWLEKDDQHDTVVQKLLSSIAPRYLDRPGGYTRIVRLSKRRLGDAGPLAAIQLLTTDGSPPRKHTPAKGAEKKK